MLKFITNYITDLYYLVTVTPKIITIAETIPNNGACSSCVCCHPFRGGIASSLPHISKLKQCNKMEQ